MHDNTLTKMLATTAVIAAMAALLAGPAGAVLLDTDGDSSGTTAVAAPAEPGTIPYLSHGIGVDESQFSGETSLGLTGDSALTRVSAPEPEGLTGDSPRTRGEIAVSSGTVSSSDDDWGWVGLGSGLAAVFAVAVGAMYLSARHRGRVALP